MDNVDAPPHGYNFVGEAFRTPTGRWVRKCWSPSSGSAQYWFDLEQRVFLTALQAMYDRLL